MTIVHGLLFHAGVLGAASIAVVAAQALVSVALQVSHSLRQMLATRQSALCSRHRDMRTMRQIYRRPRGWHPTAHAR